MFKLINNTKYSEILVEKNLPNIEGKTYNNIPDAITYANSVASSTNPIEVNVKGEITLGNPISLEPYVSLRGIGTYNTVIQVDDSLAGSSIITLNYSTFQSIAPLGNFQLLGSSTLKSTANTIAINVSGMGVSYINTIRLESFNTGIRLDNNQGNRQIILVEDNITVRDCVTGVYCDRSSPTFAKSVTVDCTVNYDVQTNANLVIEKGSMSGFQNTQTDTGIIMTGTPTVSLNTIEFSNLNIGAVLDEPTVIFNSCNFEDDTLTHAIVNGPANLRSLQTRLNTNLVVFNAVLNNFDGNFVSYAAEDKSTSIIDKLNVGLPNNPQEAAFGGGNSYNTAALFYEFDGSTFSTVKPELTAEDGTTFTFSNTNVNTALYISNLYGIPFRGLKVKVDSVAVLGGGSIVYEYWDGSSWTEFNHMSSLSSGTYLPFGNDQFTAFAGTGNFQIRFDERIVGDWVTNDPISLGVPLYWVRIRIASAITTSPTFDKIKIDSDRTEFNEDGYKESFGNARSIRKFPITYGSFVAGVNSPSNQDIYLSDGVFAGRNENEFANGTTDSTGVGLIVPYDIDTSCPIKVRLNIQGESNVAGAIRFELRWAFTFRGQPIYTTTGNAPAVNVTERSTEQTVSYTAGEIFRTVAIQTFELEIPELIAQIAGGDGGDLLMITIERNANNPADTYNGNVIINDIAFEYTSWRDGGHYLAL